MPPKKAMSVPDRKAAYMSAFEEVRVNRGSTLMRVAPLSMALPTHFMEMGWFSAALDPIIRMQSELRMSIQ